MLSKMHNLQVHNTDKKMISCLLIIYIPLHLVEMNLSIPKPPTVVSAAQAVSGPEGDLAGQQ